MRAGKPAPRGFRRVPSEQVIDFSVRSTMSAEEVLRLDGFRPGFLDAQINMARTTWIYGRLRKRYAVPFLPEPEIVTDWIARLVTPAAYRARGVDPTDPALANALKDKDDALAELKEAADGNAGMYDFPTLDDGSASGVSQGEPLFYAEQDPYEWQDRQAERRGGRCR